MTNLQTQLISLLRGEQISELAIFLENLTESNRIALIPTIRNFANNEYIRNAGESLSHVQHQMISMCAFKCYDARTVSKLRACEIYLLSHEELLKWYCPSWFSDYINRTEIQNPVHYIVYYKYEVLIEWIEKEYLHPCSELIARAVAHTVYEVDSSCVYKGYGKISHKFIPEKLLEYPVILEKHIWHLFQSPSNVNQRNAFIYVNNYDDEKANWLEIFKQLSSQQLISRERVLKECLLGTTRGLNKSLSDWFVKLFNAMEPSDTECVNLQEELFASVMSRNSNAISNALKLFPRIINDSSFERVRLESLIPTLLSSETKSIVTKAQALAKKLKLNNFL